MAGEEEEWLCVLDAGGRVSLEAVPGAGKTHRLIAACRNRKCLLLAYNTQLASETQRHLSRLGLSSDDVLCVTFHALCGKCLQLARDDAQLLAAVEMAECGELAVHDVPDVACVLIDEAQDVRSLYVRLLRVLGLTRPGMAMLVAGDRRQLIYDFDPDFPASLDTLLEPERAFGGKDWRTYTLTHTRRLTAPMANFVNAMFGCSIASIREDFEDPLPVEIRAPKRSAFRMAEMLQDVVEEATSCGRSVLLLVDRKRGNRPLISLLNTWSREGRRVFVHGIDADEADEAGGEEGIASAVDVRCGSYWSAKGLECDTAVVLLPRITSYNPTYVALTRARRRLIVVLDPKKPHAAAAHACVAGRDQGWVQIIGGDAARAVEDGVRLVASDSLTTAEDASPADDAPLRHDLERWDPSRILLGSTSTLTCNTESSTSSSGGGDSLLLPLLDGRPCDMGNVVVQMALAMAEHRVTGRVRAMEDILRPLRLESGPPVARAIGQGLASRHVPVFVEESSLLAPDLRAAAQAAYARFRTLDDIAEVALAIGAWDGYDHIMRRCRPVMSWVHDERIRLALDWTLDHLPMHSGEGILYDYRLRRGDQHARVQASHPTRGIFHVTWGRSSHDDGAAAVRAALHPTHRATIVDVAQREITEVTSEDPTGLLADARFT